MMNDSAAGPGGGGSSHAGSIDAGGAGAAAARSSGPLRAALQAISQTDQAQVISAQLAEHLGAGSALDQSQRRIFVRAVVERVQRDNYASILAQTLPNIRIDGNKTLASFLADLGPEGLPTIDLLRSFLQRFGYTNGSLDDRAVTEIIAGLLSIGSEAFEGQVVTDFSVLVRGLASFSRFASWRRIVRALGQMDGLQLPRDVNWEGLAVLLLVAPTPEGDAPAVTGLWGVWPRPLRQLQVLSGLLSLPQEVFNFGMLQGRRVVSADDVASASQTVRQLASQVQASQWNSLDLIETLVQIAETQDPDARLAVTEMLERAVKASAELVLMGLVQIPQPWSHVHAELASKLLAMFLAGHPSHQLVFLRLWQTNRAYLLTAFRNFYNDSPMNVTRLLDVAQDLKILDALLEIRPLYMALDVAALAARREYLNLDKWLQDNINEHGNAFLRACLEFLDSKAKDDLSRQDPQAEQNFLPLTVQTVAIFLRVLRSNGDSMTPEEIDYFKVVRNLCLQLHPRLMNLAPGAEGQEPGLQVVTFSQDVHEEADSWYRQMYEEKVGIEDVVALLQRSKASSDPRDHQLFACMVHTLFDEYRWFEMYYPPRELAMTAIVFGSLIQHQLIDYIPLGIAIRYVLDALRNPPDSNMFKFGLQALLRFQDRLPEWPQLGQALLSLPHVQQSHPEIARVLRNAMSGVANGGAAGAKGAVAAAPEEEEKVPFMAIHVDPLPEEEQQREPDEDTSDKVLFIVNNLSPSNLDSKLAEARTLITPDIHHWFSSYLVLQRVSIEPNNHALYTDFLDGLDSTPLLLRHVLHETFAKVKMLLNSDKTVQSTNERTLLKNLASWLGGLTLARDKPIRHRNIAFKELLIQGYDSNRLIVAIPFVCKVLEQCARSTVFVPPNPWLMAVLRLLVELYQFADLKLNLKFEIEVLCKTLGIDLNAIEATTILRKRPEELAAAAAAAQLQQQQQAAQQQAHQQALQQQAAQAQAQQAAQQQVAQQQQGYLQQPPSQFSQQGQQQLGGGQLGALSQDMDRLSMGPGGQQAARTALEAQQRARVAGTGATQAPAQAGAGAVGSAAAAQAYAETLAVMLQSLPLYIVINPQLTLFANNPTLKRMISMAIERAVREIITPVVERSVTIASIATRELIVKDFAMEGDEGKMRRSAHSMVSSLAGNLALVTCKEPLRISMVTHARSLFLQSGFTEQTLPEQAIVVIMQENLELACSVVERAAMEKALPEVDEGLSSAYSSRRDHRSRGRGYYWDNQALTTSQYAATLPDLLRLKPDGLQPSQLRVYEEFGKLPRASSASPSDGGRGGGVATDGASGASEAGGAPALMGSPFVAAAGQEAGVAGLAAETLLPGSLSPQQSLEKFQQYLAEAERLLHAAEPQETAATLAPNHPLRQVVRQIPLIAAASVTREETALAYSQKIIQLLYKCETQLARETYVILLERLCEVSQRVAKEVTAWLIYAEDERKLHVPVTVALIRAGLINVVEQDLQLAKLIARDLNPALIDFAALLALECLREPACATRGQLANTIEALNRAVQRGKGTDAASQLLEELEGGQLKTKADVGATAMREQLAYCFAEWVRLSQQSPNSEKSFIDFVTQLQTQGILKGEEISSMFFRVCTEVGVDSYIKQKAVGGTLATGIFSPIDAFARLVMLMIKYHADPTGANNEQAKVHYLTKILSIVVLVMAQSHEELGPHFQQKPFFRLFSSLLHDLHLLEGSLQSTYLQALLAISNTLNTLQPSFFPGFTFSWMSLISHRLFMPKLLLAPEAGGARAEGWAAFHRLFLSLLRFLAPMLRTAELRETSRTLYRGTLRILLVLLHDVPDFLAHYHHSLCDVIPTSCIQLRNLVLSSFPRTVILPDPFQPNLKIDRLPHSQENPVILSDYTTILSQQQGGAFKTKLDAYLRDRAPQAFLGSIKEVLLVTPAPAGAEQQQAGAYNVPLLNALVLYVGIASLERPQNLLTGNADQDVCVDMVQELLSDLDAEGRYLLISAAANQLRWPSSHTAFFSGLLLYLFGSDAEMVREQILRVLLERLIVNRPHPFGVLCTTFEILRNRRYASLMPKAPPEIARLLSHMRAGLVADAGAAAAAAQQQQGGGQGQGSQQQQQLDGNGASSDLTAAQPVGA